MSVLVLFSFLKGGKAGGKRSNRRSEAPTSQQEQEKRVCNVQLIQRATLDKVPVTSVPERLLAGSGAHNLCWPGNAYRCLYLGEKKRKRKKA